MQSEREESQQLNVEVERELYVQAKKTALDWGLKLNKFIRNVLLLGVYFKENLGPAETKYVTQENYALACLLSARNELSHRGFPDIPELDNVIKKVEAFTGKESEGEG